MAQIELHHGDLPAGLTFQGDIAIDTEAMGLRVGTDRLCLVQLKDETDRIHLVKFDAGKAYDAPNLCALLTDPTRVKIFHFARFDAAILQYHLNIVVAPIYCTKIASKIARSYTDRHGLKDLCREMLGVELSKQQQSSDWGQAELTGDQHDYAASDVLHLHALRDKLNNMLAREGRAHLLAPCLQFLPHRAALDLAGYEPVDIFHH